MVHRPNQEPSYFLTRGWLSARVLYSFTWTYFRTGRFKTWYRPTHTLGVMQNLQKENCMGEFLNVGSC